MDKLTSVPYVVYESSQSRLERLIKKLIIALIVSIIVTLASNIAWMIMWNQYEYVSEETTRTYVQDGEGVNIIGSANEVNNEPISNIYPKDEIQKEKE